jgi:hypothetical protein
MEALRNWWRKMQRASALLSTSTLSACAFLGPDEVHYDPLDNPNSTQGSVIRHWTVTDEDTDRLLNEGCAKEYQVGRKIAFAAVPGQRVQVKSMFESVSVLYSKWSKAGGPDTDEFWCGLSKSPPVRPPEIRNPECWGFENQPVLRSGDPVDRYDVAEIVSVEIIPSNAPRTGTINVRADGHRVTYRILATGTAHYDFTKCDPTDTGLWEAFHTSQPATP